LNDTPDSPLAQARYALRQTTHADERTAVAALLAAAEPGGADRAGIVATAHAIVSASRSMSAERGTLDAFMQEFGLSNQEGVALMCLAEALLRIPNAETQYELIAEKIISGNWEEHRGRSQDMFVNAGTWALMLTGGVIKLDENITRKPGNWVRSTTARVGEPVIRKAAMQAMRIMGHQFVFGRTIREAMKKRAQRAAGNQLFSFDMLGEGARTAADAERAVIKNSTFLRAFGVSGRSAKAGEIWRGLMSQEKVPAEFSGALELIMNAGTLSRRILKATGSKPTRQRLREVYTRLCECLSTGEMFHG